jgi:hypothetical protein
VQGLILRQDRGAKTGSDDIIWDTGLVRVQSCKTTSSRFPLEVTAGVLLSSMHERD